jgi:WD40 repeat protein/energy-coupling factor transporter ATP-binding protein EcfA2
MDNIDLLEHQLEGISLIANPFPGLRPFSIDESHLFFGREGQSDEVLLKLSENKFVAVIGASGSGKSSFMYCGVIPILYGGFLTEAGSNWEVLPFRPGGAPIDNLADVLLTQDPDFLQADEEEKLIRKRIIATLLRSSSAGLIEAVGQTLNTQNKNILLLVDQFEELFRFKKTEEGTANESLAFVNLLLEAIKAEGSHIYVALTMRSDFIGECAQFPDLTKKINDSHYLIPQMTREQKRGAVEGPVAVGGGTITARLVQQLLNDLGDNPDQLPILQHALMRTWDYWRQHKEGDEPLDLPHYDAIGRMEEALSQHANEAYDELNPEDKLIAERLFKTITEKGGDIQGIRRPTRLGAIAAICQVEEDRVIRVIEKFREPGRSLLMPPAGVPLYSHTVVDISHESLMRIWVRLKNWVDQEGAAVQMYLRLSDAAALYQQGKSGLWRPPDLQLAINWADEHKPSLEWAQRYNPAFERTMVFLETSKTAYDTEQRIKEMLQRRKLRNTRIVALVMTVAAVISLFLLVFAVIQKQKADEQTLIALEQRKRAEANEKEANDQRLIALESEKKAIAAAEEAERQKLIAEDQRSQAEKSAAEAIRQKSIALQNEAEANKQKNIAIQEKARAEENEKIAKEQTLKAEENERKAYKLRLLSISQSMAVKSLQVVDTARKAAVAMQSYVFNRDNGGPQHNHDVYDALYYALKSLKGEEYNKLEGHKDAVRAIVHSNDGNYLYTAGSDGLVYRWRANSTSGSDRQLVADTRAINRAIALSSDGKWLAVASALPYILVVDQQNSANQIRLPVAAGMVSSMTFLAGGSQLVTAGADSTVRLWNIPSTEPTIIGTANDRINSIAASFDGQLIATVNDNGRVMLLDKKQDYAVTTLIESAGRKIYALAFARNKPLLVVGSGMGTVKLWNYKEKRVIKTFLGHRARVNQAAFSPDDNLLATGSLDNTIRLWNLNNFNDQSIDLKDHNSWVWSLSFSQDSKRLVAGCVDNLIRIWPTTIDDMAAQMCGLMSRNMSDQEWEQFVAPDIPFESTCPKLPKGAILKDDE